jgi:methyltransferase-like protein
MEEKYQTGNFGPITLKYLENKRGENIITKEVYDDIMKNCKQSSINDKNNNTDNIKSVDDLGIEAIDSVDTNF